jgi:hypothetical protein
MLFIIAASNSFAGTISDVAAASSALLAVNCALTFGSLDNMRTGAEAMSDDNSR